MAVVHDLGPHRFHLKDVHLLPGSLALYRLHREQDVTRHLVGVADLEASLGLTSDDHIVKDEFLIIFPIHTTIHGGILGIL